VTCVTATLSLAVPLKDNVDDVVVKVAAGVGPVMVTNGDVESPAAVIVHVNVWDACNTPSEIVAVTLNVPALVGVPEMNPVPTPSDNPGGMPLAV